MDKLVQIVPQVSTIFHNVSRFLVVMAVKVLVALGKVSNHFPWPFEEQFVLNLLQNLPDQLSKHCTDHLVLVDPDCPT